MWNRCQPLAQCVSKINPVRTLAPSLPWKIPMTRHIGNVDPKVVAGAKILHHMFAQNELYNARRKLLDLTSSQLTSKAKSTREMSSFLESGSTEVSQRRCFWKRCGKKNKPCPLPSKKRRTTYGRDDAVSRGSELSRGSSIQETRQSYGTPYPEPPAKEGSVYGNPYPETPVRERSVHSPPYSQPPTREVSVYGPPHPEPSAIEGGIYRRTTPSTRYSVPSMTASNQIASKEEKSTAENKSGRQNAGLSFKQFFKNMCGSLKKGPKSKCKPKKKGSSQKYLPPPKKPSEPKHQSSRIALPVCCPPPPPCCPPPPPPCCPPPKPACCPPPPPCCPPPPPPCCPPPKPACCPPPPPPCCPPPKPACCPPPPPPPCCPPPPKCPPPRCPPPASPCCPPPPPCCPPPLPSCPPPKCPPPPLPPAPKMD